MTNHTFGMRGLASSWAQYSWASGAFGVAGRRPVGIDRCTGTPTVASGLPSDVTAIDDAGLELADRGSRLFSSAS